MVTSGCNKASLLEMPIGRKGFFETEPLHDNKRDAVRQCPALVQPSGEQIQAGVKQAPCGGNHPYLRVAPEVTDELDDGASHRRAAQCISDFCKDPIGRNHPCREVNGQLPCLYV